MKTIAATPKMSPKHLPYSRASTQIFRCIDSICVNIKDSRSADKLDAGLQTQKIVERLQISKDMQPKILIVGKKYRLQRGKKHTKICRFAVVMWHQVQLLTGNSVSKTKVHYTVGWKIFAGSIFFSII